MVIESTTYNIYWKAFNRLFILMAFNKAISIFLLNALFVSKHTHEMLLFIFNVKLKIIERYIALVVYANDSKLFENWQQTNKQIGFIILFLLYSVFRFFSPSTLNESRERSLKSIIWPMFSIWNWSHISLVTCTRWCRCWAKKWLKMLWSFHSDLQSCIFMCFVTFHL